MWKSVLVFLCILAVCYCQNNNNNNAIGNRHCKKKHHHHYNHHLLYGLLYYGTFLLIKIKVIFVLGTIFTIFLTGGKLFGIIKYLELAKGKNHAPEKVYIQEPHHHDHDYHHHDKILYNAPSFHGGPPSNFPSGGGFTVDKLPPNAEIAGGSYNAPPPGAFGGYGRSSNDGIYNKFAEFFDLVPKLNITNIVFNSMKIKSDECRRRFVCKAEFNSKRSYLLHTGLNLFSDEEYDHYKTTNETIAHLDDCDHLYPNCDNNKI